MRAYVDGVRGLPLLRAQLSAVFIGPVAERQHWLPECQFIS